MPSPFVEQFGGLEFAMRAALAGREGRHFAVGGLVGSSSALLLASLDRSTPALRLVVCAGPDEAALLRQDLAFFLGGDGGVRFFPAFDSVKTESRARETGRVADRTSTVESLAASLHDRPRFVVAPIAALLQPVPSPTDVARSRVAFRVGGKLDVDALATRLTDAGFARMPMVEGPGEWSRRGGIVDVYPRGRDLPVRIELFGDEIESVRRFDPTTQRSVAAVPEIAVPVLSTEEASGVANVDAKRASLLVDLLPAGTTIVHVEESAAAAWMARFEKARPEEDLGALYARFALKSLAFPNLRLSSAPVAPAADAANARLLTATGLARDLVTFHDAVNALVTANDTVRLLCDTDGETQRVRTLLDEAGLGKERRLAVATGRLSHGFQIPALRTALLSCDEIFGRTRMPRPTSTGGGARAASAPEWTELRIGDTVVHLDHGIAIYRGLQTVTKDGLTGEHLTLEFEGGTTMYVPASKASLVHKYVGAGEVDPKLSTVGGKDWDGRKARVAAAVEGIAQDLLTTHALRRARPGVAFPPDAPEQREFEATFPFELTPDQEKAIAAIKADMERATPSDRLICGDVGFGKTELAVRAAFKTVFAGRQVAVLVPTTVLAEQHGEVFAERFAGYPITVEVLSRFRTDKEQRRIIERAATGGVDVLIGTHRLVSGDVKFKDLGLLVVDEEQRFGVKAKEALRQYRATVDVLTLTATPIPRTLHMALLGLRDISSLTTAPFGRRAIETRVVAGGDDEIRDALLAEIERGGQAYFIHNRVQSIERVAAKVRQLVPEARVTVVHGQMADHLIEERMHEFVAHQVDVLAATTIVESGLDIRNANTIVIDDAHQLGLADLHQLRGRVGRYDKRAYCLLVVPPGTLATDAEKRVRAVEELSELGSGFRIAMRDLEIRGAGNLLGAEQSGHIAAVGYELYCALLADAVKRVKKERTEFRTACHVNLPVDAAVPTNYVADDRQRMELYRRFACAAEATEVAAILEEARDRFGPAPDEVRTLAQLARVRILGERLGVVRISMIRHDGQDRVQLACVEPRRVKNALAHLGTRLRVVDDTRCHLLPPPGSADSARLADAVLLALSRRGSAP
jgi:transcription-repair coupling factor (superfamily II helicase)